MVPLRLFLTILTVICLILSLLAAPFMVNNVAMAQDEVPSGWEIEITLSHEQIASINNGNFDPLATLQAEGHQVLLEGDRLLVSGRSGVDELRHVLYEAIGNGFTLIRNRTDLALSMPLTEGQTFTLKLDTNITTGYSWQFTDSDSPAIAQEGDALAMARGDDRLVGAPQVVTYIYKASGTGISKLNLAYKRPFGEPEDAKTRVNLRLAEYNAVIDLSDPSPDLPSLPADDTGPINPPIPDEPLNGLPASFDWRSYGYVPPIRDQGSCGSCWAFGSTGAFESAVRKGGGPLTNLSEQFLVSCNKDGWGCNGGFGSDALKYYVNTLANYQTAIGAVLESAKPYTATNGTCTVAYSHPYKGYSYGYVAATWSTIPTPNQIKNAIYTYGPLDVAICAGSSFQSYSTGVFSTDESSGCSYANHEVILVGWNDATQTWILRNSWGTGWGEDGYMRIKWGTSRVGIEAAYIRYTAPAPNVPTTVLPSGNTMDKTPTYKWKAISGATKYQVLVYKGSNKVVDKTYTSSVCSGSYCYATPTTALTTAGYTWKVRAYKGTTWYAYSSTRSFAIIAAKPPTPVSPSGTVTDTTPTYKWTYIYGATQYQIQVYKGSTLIVNKVYTSSVCSGSYCSATPTTVLAYAGHTWKVRVYINGVWTAYSAAKSFTVAKAAPGFNSQFTSNATGWAPVNGTWTLVTTSPGYYRTYGIAGTSVSAAYNANFTTLDYQVKLKRIGCSTCANRLMIRGITTPLSSTNHWYKTYAFQFANNGQFSVWEDSASTSTPLQPWTITSYILNSNWNTLRVIASGSSLKFYINGHLVWSGTDTSFASGKVGFGIYNDSSTGNALYVDWATLATTISASAGDMSEPMEETGEEFPEWTDMNTAPH